VNPIEPQAGDGGDPVAGLFGRVPNEAANVVGAAARTLLVNHIVGNIPGMLPRDRWVGEWAANTVSYRSAFVPYYQRRSQQTAIDEYWEVTSFWQRLAAAMLAQRIHEVTQATRKTLDRPKIDYVVNAELPTVGWFCLPVYAAAAAESDTYAALLQQARRDATALTRYAEALTSPAWINSRRVAYANGTWYQQSWELYHHLVKLHLLGATIEQARRTIRTAIAKGLPVPGALSWEDFPTWWPPYAPWLKPLTVDTLSGLDERITHTRVVVAGMRPVSIPEFYAKQFCDVDQPAYKFRTASRSAEPDRGDEHRHTTTADGPGSSTVSVEVTVRFPQTS
jgi:hypothetical protein